MSERQTKILWWWPWQTDKVEAYLEKQAGEGWVLVNAGWVCASFTFERRAPAKVRYCLDYQEKMKPDYQALFQDAGWKMEYHGSGWYIWSMPHEGVRPEIYTDDGSLIRRNNAILASISAVLAAQLPMAVVTLQNLDEKSSFALALTVVWAFCMALQAGVVIGMAVGINRLKHKKSQKVL